MFNRGRNSVDRVLGDHMDVAVHEIKVKEVFRAGLCGIGKCRHGQYGNQGDKGSEGFPGAGVSFLPGKTHDGLLPVDGFFESFD
jgi:hypothetical protein